MTLTGRFAKCCTDSTIVESSTGLAFFEYRGKGSRDATETCATCLYHYRAHDTENPTHKHDKHCHHCDYFVPHGPYEFDRYYCGHGGWD